MHKGLLLLLFLGSQSLLAQDLSRDLEFVETQNTQGNASSLPIYVNVEGELNIIGRNPDLKINFSPLAYATYKTSKSLYNNPVQRSTFTLSEGKDDNGWIEVKRKRWELGAGIATNLLSNVMSVGLVPFKGARQVMIRHKRLKNQKTEGPKLPDNLEEVSSWSINDRGTFQRYGGVQINAGLRYSIINIVTVGLVVQNLFNVMVEKISENKVKLTVAEEHLNKRRIQSGTTVAKANLHVFNGKRLTLNFVLELDNPDHHKLYKLAMQGKLDALQDKLPKESQDMQWRGSERIGYIGIPGIVGKQLTRSEYEMNFDGEEDVLDIKSRKNSGWFLPLRNQNRLVYQTDSAITLFWFSEMNKTDEEVFNKRFLTPGRIMGARGFDLNLPSGTKMGSTLSQMGMSFTRDELENVTLVMLEEILNNFKQRCEEMDLSCGKRKNFNKISNTLRNYVDKKWEDIRDKLGFLMIDEPALIHSYVKTIKSKKKVYFKFLNEKFQSMEGAAPIEI